MPLAYALSKLRYYNGMYQENSTIINQSPISLERSPLRRRRAVLVELLWLMLPSGLGAKKRGLGWITVCNGI